MTLHVLVIVYIIWTLRDPTKVTSALNSLGSQPVALIVLLIGCSLVVISKWYGIDTTIAGGVIGVAGNMLTGSGTPKHAPGEAMETQIISKTATVPGVELPPTDTQH